MSNRTMEGWIDERGQPVIPVQLERLEDSVVALIDTGFNREFIIFEEHARQAQLMIESDTQIVALADGSQKRFLKSGGTIEWLGEQRRVNIFIIPGSMPRHGRWQVGTQLLRDCRLEIDFRERSVRLSH
ncbi:MAG: hypothetical protein AAB338_02690 [Patescibacteria group bacterium]